MNTILFFTAFIFLAIIYTIIGLAASKKISSTNDYFLADRNLGLAPVMFTLIATQLGGGLLLGTSQQAYYIGIYGIVYTLGISIGFLLLASGLASTLQSLNVSTTAELFQTRYKAPLLKKIASFLSIITLSGILIGQIVAAKSLLASLAFLNEPIFIMFWLSIIGYTMIGGLKAVAMTDSFQVLFVIFLFSTIFLYSIYLNPQSIITLARAQQYFTPDFINTSDLAVTLSMPALFALIEQDLAQRFFAARTKKIAVYAALGSALFILTFSLIPIYFGMQAQLAQLDLLPNSSPLIPILSTIVNDFFLVLVVCGIIAAITSTADSLLCAISSNLAQDFDLSFLGMSPLRRSQWITLFIGLTTLIASYFMPQNIIAILIGSYEISVSCLLIPLLFCYFYKDVYKEAAFGAMLGGIIGLIGFRWWQMPLPKEFASLILSFIGYIIGTIIGIKIRKLK